MLSRKLFSSWNVLMSRDGVLKTLKKISEKNRNLSFYAIVKLKDLAKVCSKWISWIKY